MKVKFLLLVLLVNSIDCKLNKQIDCQCRLLAENRIINGRIAHHLSYPFLASISYNSFRMMNKNMKKFLPISLKMSGLTCSATILNERFLLSSAICLLANLDHLTIGLKNQNDLVKMFDDDHLPIKQVLIHPKFNTSLGKDFGFNFALIELKNKINFTSDLMRPACLDRLEKRDDKQRNYANQLKMAGWGSTVNEMGINDNFKHRFLKEVDLIDRSNVTSQCLENSKLMCTRSLNKHDIVAINDLGGSLLNTIDGRSYVVSILSNLDIKVANERAHFTDLQFSARISNAIEFIEQHLAKDYCF